MQIETCDCAWEPCCVEAEAREDEAVAGAWMECDEEVAEEGTEGVADVDYFWEAGSHCWDGTGTQLLGYGEDCRHCCRGLNEVYGVEAWGVGGGDAEAVDGEGAEVVGIHCCVDVGICAIVDWEVPIAASMLATVVDARERRTDDRSKPMPWISS